MLCDAGTFEPIRSGVVSPKLGARARAGDGVVGGLGRVDGRPVACYAQDVSFLGGSLGAAHADTIDRVLQLAGRSRVPVVGFIESGGARMQEGHGGARWLRADLPPQRRAVGRGAADLDHRRAVGRRRLLLAGADRLRRDDAGRCDVPHRPAASCRDVMGEDVSAAELGGHKVHDRNGVCDLVVEDDRAAAALSRALLSYLPQHSGAGLPRTLAREPELADPGAAVPDDPRKVYDVREVDRRHRRRRLAAGDPAALGALDRHRLRAHRRAPGRRDRQPAALPRRRARRRVVAEGREIRGAPATRIGVPLVVLVDTPGFMPGTRQEQAGVIRFGATLRARVRGGDRAARDGRAAQGLRRRVHHDELEGPRRRHGVRVAWGGAGRDGRAADGRDHPPPRAGRRRGPGRRRERRLRPPTRRSTSAPTWPRPQASSTR